MWIYTYMKLLDVVSTAAERLPVEPEAVPVEEPEAPLAAPLKSGAAPVHCSEQGL